MNNLFFGFIAIALVLGFSLEGDLSGYVQMHSMIIVIGGTAAILIFSTPGPVLKSLWRSLIDLTRHDSTMSNFKDDLQKLSDNREIQINNSHHIISYAQEMWSQGIDPDLFIVLLSQKKKEIDGKSADAVQAIKNLAKYPPTLGMTGTVMGMISLFSSLDSENANVGTSLSVAMTATFFGLILANLFIAPLADRLHVKQVNQKRMLENLYEVLLLINQGQPSALIKEELMIEHPKPTRMPRPDRDHEQNEVHDDGHSWAVSYADFLMVLLSFFILFFSIDKNERAELIDHIAAKATEKGGKGVAGKDRMDGKARLPAGIESITASVDGLLVERQNDSQRLFIYFEDNIYRPRQIEFPPEQIAKLKRILVLLEPYIKDVNVTFVGHTDNTAVSRKNKYITDNFDISSLRATKALQQAVKAGFDAKKMYAKGEAEHSKGSRTLSLIVSPTEGNK